MGDLDLLFFKISDNFLQTWNSDPWIFLKHVQTWLLPHNICVLTLPRLRTISVLLYSICYCDDTRITTVIEIDLDLNPEDSIQSISRTVDRNNK